METFFFFLLCIFVSIRNMFTWTVYREINRFLREIYLWTTMAGWKHGSLVTVKGSESRCAPHRHTPRTENIQSLKCAEVVWRTPISLYTTGAGGKTQQNESSAFNSAPTVAKMRRGIDTQVDASARGGSCACLLVCCVGFVLFFLCFVSSTAGK